MFDIVLSKEREILHIGADALTVLGHGLDDVLGTPITQWLAVNADALPSTYWSVGQLTRTAELCLWRSEPLADGVHIGLTCSPARDAPGARTPLEALRHVVHHGGSLEGLSEAVLLWDWKTGHVLGASPVAMEQLKWDLLPNIQARALLAEGPYMADRLNASLGREGQTVQRCVLVRSDQTRFVVQMQALLSQEMSGEMRCIVRYEPLAIEPASARSFDEAYATLASNEPMASLGQMAMGVVHEVNNPACWVLGNLQLMRDMLDAGDNLDELPDMLGECIEGMERIGRLMGALSQYGRYQTRQLRPFEALPLIDEAVSLAQPYLHEQVRLETEVSPDLLLYGERRELVVALVELLKNAAQATCRDVPRVPSSEPRDIIRIHVHRCFDRILIDVSDTGPGIPKGIRRRMFLPLFTTRPGRRYGLGLTTCLDVVKRHRGQLLFESQESGTLFRIALPSSNPIKL
ncbi:MAG: HAMP domain-containing sensor histidine kinase [Myxococcota bacterium]